MVRPAFRLDLSTRAIVVVGGLHPKAAERPVQSLADKADVLIHYCSGQADTLRDVPAAAPHPAHGRLLLNA